MIVYFDNAATTPLDEDVFETMLPYMRQHFGNPSSAHKHGRMARSVIESSRKTIADLLNVGVNEILFTSGGTEADNTAIFSACRGLGVKHAITSRLEHPAVLNTLKALQDKGEITLSFVLNDDDGNLDLDHLEQLLQGRERSFVSLMHGNNEIGNLNDIGLIGQLCKKYGAIFHTDTVQTMGHYEFDLAKLDVHFLVGSAHKFHGPKGIGFLYVKNSVQASPLIYGGSQERHLRAGTENVAGIAGMAKALEIGYAGLKQDRQHVEGLKQYVINSLSTHFTNLHFNGNSAHHDRSLYTVLNVGFACADTDILTNLDLSGISASGGSACNSSGKTSHVLKVINSDSTRQAIRLSFSKHNTRAEVDFLIEKLLVIHKELIPA